MYAAPKMLVSGPPPSIGPRCTPDPHGFLAEGPYPAAGIRSRGGLLDFAVCSRVALRRPQVLAADVHVRKQQRLGAKEDPDVDDGDKDEKGE